MCAAALLHVVCRVCVALQAPALGGPTPRFWPVEECERLLDIAEASLCKSIQDLKLRYPTWCGRPHKAGNPNRHGIPPGIVPRCVRASMT